MKDLDYYKRKAEKLKFRNSSFIDGKFVKTSLKYESINPFTNQPIVEMYEASTYEIEEAIKIANKRFKQGVWKKKAPRDKMSILFKLADLIEKNKEELAILDTIEMGKSIQEALEIDHEGAVTCIRFISEAIDKIAGKVPNTQEDYLHYILRQPLGTIAAITPWNYPLMMSCWKIAPALAAGNSIVLKPTEEASLSSLRLAELFVEAGGPEGVFNVVLGGENVGRPLAMSHDIDKVTFTGSTEVGKLIMEYSAKSNMKKFSVECGGKSPVIIFEDTKNLDRSAEIVVHGIYNNQGEVCSAGSRIFVQDAIYDDFIEKFQKHSSFYKAGNPLEPQTTLGPLVNKEQQKKVLNYIQIGKQEGAKLIFGGDIPQEFASGCFVNPTLFADTHSKMKIIQEEIFGPVASIIKFKDEKDLISLANDSIYGLAAGIFTSDIDKAHTVARDIQAGLIWINDFMNTDMSQPWGGWKQSGQGKDNCIEALLEHTQLKSVWTTLNQ